nr:zinc finger BED domain-containing protein RICESLEEPER 2 [Tanacetum cinerariifolium]
MYFCAPKVDIVKNLKPLRNDYELANFVKLSYDNGCKVELYVEHHGYNVLDGVNEEVVGEELDDEIKMEDVSKFVGLDHVGEEDVELSNTGLNDIFLNMLVDGKFISDKDFGTKVDTQSSSSRNVDDSFVDGRFKVANGYQLWYRRNDYRNILVLCGKNVKEGRCPSHKGIQKVVEDIGTPKLPKSKKGKSKKSQSPKTLKTLKTLKTPKTPKSPMTPKSPIATSNADAAKKGCSFRLWTGWMQSEASFKIKTLVHTCKIHVKYRSFHSIRAESPYDTKLAKMAQGKDGPPKIPSKAAPPPYGVYIPSPCLGEG